MDTILVIFAILGGISSLLAIVIFVYNITIKEKRQEVINRLRKKKRIIMSSDDNEWEHNLFSRIFNKEVKNKRAYFIEYSGINAKKIIDKALKCGWEVHLYIKDPEFESSNYQKNRIINTLNTLKVEYKQSISKQQLLIYKYKNDFGISARYFEDELLMYSWYLKLCKSCIEGNTLFGHDCLNFTVTKEMKEWDRALKFWNDNLQCRFELNGCSEKEVCQKEIRV